MSTNHVRAALESSLEQRTERLADCIEDQWFDRKSARIRVKDLGPALVAFANAEGGVVVLGLDEDLSERESLLNGWQQAAVDVTAPPVHTHVHSLPCKTTDGADSWIGVIEIESSEGVHETTDGNCYLRIGDETRKLSFVQRQELHFDKGQSSFDSKPARGASLDSLDPELLASYKTAAASVADDETLLRNRGLITRAGDVTNAGVLLFAYDPQEFVANADIRVIRYRSNERGQGRSLAVDADDDIRISATLPAIVEQAAQIVEQWAPARRALGASGRFERVPVIPRDVWLEAIVNAVVHRSYSLTGDHIRIEIFPNRIEVTSPGRFPGLVRLDDPETIARFSRNPRVARVMVDLGLVRELGEGIRRMFAEMRRGGLVDPVYRQTEGSVTVILQAETRLDDDVEARLSRGSLDILQLLRTADRPLGTGDVADATRMARPTAIRALRALEREGLIVWSGKSPKDPRAVWQISEVN